MHGLNACPSSPKLILIKLSVKRVPFTIISCYAPALVSDPEDKDNFYCDLDTLINDTPVDRFLLAIGNFNARTGCNYDAWAGALANMG